MSPRLKKILFILLRTVVCVVAMWWVLSKVHWHDWATLADSGQQVQITNLKEVLAQHPNLDADPENADIDLQIASADAQHPESVRVSQLALKQDGSLNLQVGLVTTWAMSNKALIGLAILIYAPIALLQSVRLTWMVRAQEIDLSYWEGIKLSYAGNFLNFVAIGSTGGDIYKAYYVSKHTTRKTEAVTTVFLDRAVGLVSLLLIAAVAMMLKFDDPAVRNCAPYVGGLMLALIGGCIVVFSQRVRRWLHVDALLQKLPFSQQLQRIDATTRRMRQHKKLLLMALLITLLLQGLAVTAITISGIGMGMNHDPELLPGYFVYIALALLIAAVPISYQGGGTMDGALQFFFLGTYGNYSQILFVGFAIRVLQLLWSLPGVLVPITGAHRPSTEKIAHLQALAACSKS